jgi:hypothetical protein
MADLERIFTDFYTCIDVKSKDIADLASKDQNITEITLNFIREIYQSIKVESEFRNNYFKSSYHLTITPLLEFFIARILYHYSTNNNLNWKINLRCQERKTSPDIRIYISENGEERTIGIVEIKARASWMQACFSEDSAISDETKRQEKSEKKNSIEDFQGQIGKYLETYSITGDQFFVFVPSLFGVDRRKYKRNIEDYKNWFSFVTKLGERNLILLSNNPRLNLETENVDDLRVTHNFELMLKTLANNSKQSSLQQQDPKLRMVK